MKRYRLLKDLPTFKVGDKYYLNENGDLVLSDGDMYRIVYHHKELDRHPNILKDWFEEIKEIKETDWKPEHHQGYWFVTDYGFVTQSVWANDGIDNARYDVGNCYQTKEDAKHAEKVQIARTKIRRSSDFKPDWDDADQAKWYVAYDHCEKCLYTEVHHAIDQGIIVSYRTDDDAERAMKDLEYEYLLHFGVNFGVEC